MEELPYMSANWDESTDSNSGDEEKDGIQVLSRYSETDQMEEDMQNLCKNDEAQNIGQLHLAAERGDAEAVLTLLTSPVNVNVLDNKQNTPLHYASRNGHISVIALLLSKNANVNSRNALGETSLHLVSEIGDVAIAQLLLNSNADVHVADQFMNTPVHIAAMHGHCELVQRLLAHDTLLNCYDNIRLLHLAAKSGHADVVQVLLNCALDVNAVDLDGNTALHLASENGHLEVAEVLLRNKADSRSTDCKTSFHFAPELGNVEIVKAMIDHEDEANAVDEIGDVVHRLAEGNGPHAAVVNVLLDRTAAGNERIQSELTINQILEGDSKRSQSSTVSATCKCQATPHADIGENLILHGTNVNACNTAKMTPLHLACQNGHASIVGILLDNHATVDVTKQSEETPLYLAAKNGHADVTDLLLLRGFSDFVLTDNVQTPLYVAVKEGHTKVVETILRHSRRLQRNIDDTNDIIRVIERIDLLRSDGRHLSAEVVLTERSIPLEVRRNSYEFIALELSFLTTQHEMVKLFFDSDQCPYSERHLRIAFHCLIKAISKEDQVNHENIKEIAHALISSSKFNVNHQDWEGQTPLQCVINSLCSSPSENIYLNYMLELLLEKGASCNMKNTHGQTPMIIASGKGHYHIVRTLLDWGIKSGAYLDLDARDRYGSTALIKAVEGRCVPIVRLLLDHNASVNLHDCHGFTALHTAVHNPKMNWFDLHFSCRPKGLRNRIFDEVDGVKAKLDPLQKILQLAKKATRIKEKIVKLILAVEETNVNARDFRGNTPLDLAVNASKRINSATLRALRKRGAVRNLLEPDDEVSIEVAGVDERGRNPLHRLAILRNSYKAREELTAVEGNGYKILLRREHLRRFTTVMDNKGRTPLHYAVMQPIYTYEKDFNLVDVFFDIYNIFNINVNIADTYGKTPLHYAATNDQYDILIECGADENKEDKHGCTPKRLKELRNLVTTNEDEAEKLPFGKEPLYASTDRPSPIAQVLSTNHVRELCKRKLVETIRICYQSPGSRESSEQAIWKIWKESELFRLNRRLSQLKPAIHQFIKRLADGIKEKDGRFECQPTLVGSAAEETKVVISTDFDFSLTLIKFSQLCHPCPHSFGPNGYFQLRRKSNEEDECQSDEEFDDFFNSDHCLLTNDVNIRFKIILEEVLSDPNFWKDDDPFEWNDRDIYKSKYEKLDGLCKTVLLRMLHPIDDGEGGFHFVDISIDIVPCVQVEGWWPEDPLPDGMDPSVKTKGSTFVFRMPSFHNFSPSTPRPVQLFSETYARISFSRLESQIIKEASFVMKAAYMVCKMILYDDRDCWTSTYQLKNCLLFCIEALQVSDARYEEDIMRSELTFLVERLMFCYMLFCRHGGFVHYFMPSFRWQSLQLEKRKEEKDNVSSEALIPFSYSVAYDYYLDVCPDDTAVDIPIVQSEDRFNASSVDPNYDLIWKEFDREKFIGMLSSK